MVATAFLTSVGEFFGLANAKMELTARTITTANDALLMDM
jgi:hypothetical protein